MQSYQEYFQDKKVTIIGLGLMGGGLNDAKFLAECGAVLTITDLKSEKELAPSIKKLSKYNRPTDGRAGIRYVLGRHNLADFRNVDFIIQPGNVPPNSPYLIEARKNNIPIYVSESLFLEQVKDIKVVGVTGTRGKTTTTCLIYEILKSFFGRKVHLGGNIKGTSALSLLNKIKLGDIVVMELDSWCLNGLGAIKKSPQVSVFTNLMSDHLNYYLKGCKDEKEAEQKYFDDKAQIYLNQKKDDFLICGEKISERIGTVKSQKIIASKNIVPKTWKLKIPGEHNLENIACAIKACEALGVAPSVIKKGVENFGGVEGRLQLIREYKGIKIYNDTTATTPDATIMALRALGPTSLRASRDNFKKIILIFGGADKNLEMSGLMKEMTKYCKSTILLSGTGTEKLRNNFKDQVKNISEFNNLKEAVKYGISLCKKRDILLFSPAFASFGMFKNEYDRGDKFVSQIEVLK